MKFLILIANILLALSAKNKIFEDDEKIIAFRKQSTNLKEELTMLRPDEESTPLKLSKEQIGRFSWALLHSMAASYPQDPTEKEKTDFQLFLNLFAEFFSCKICGAHFKQMLQDYPIENSTREKLVYYICDIHNHVNKRLNKPIFECKKAFEFWGGNCGCSAKNELEKIPDNEYMNKTKSNKD